MILNARGIVLWRRRWAETDRLVCVYTESYGRLLVRFIGADKPRAKLRAFTEPFVSAEFRLIFSRRNDGVLAGGGLLCETFPAIRGDWRRTVEALRLCELVGELTPEKSPNPEKFFLLEAALRELETSPAGWEKIAPEFGARLLASAGFGLELGSGESGEGLWERVEAAVIAQTGRPLKSTLFRERLESAGRDFRKAEMVA